MPKHTSKADRIELRNWLRRTIRSGVLDRVPPRYTPYDRADGPDTHAHARKLQAELAEGDCLWCRPSTHELLRVVC